MVQFQSHKHFPYLRRATTTTSYATEWDHFEHIGSCVLLGSHSNIDYVNHIVIASTYSHFVGCNWFLTHRIGITTRNTFAGSASYPTTFHVSCSHSLAQINHLYRSSNVGNYVDPTHLVCGFYLLMTNHPDSYRSVFNCVHDSSNSHLNALFPLSDFGVQDVYSFDRVSDCYFLASNFDSYLYCQCIHLLYQQQLD